MAKVAITAIFLYSGNFVKGIVFFILFKPKNKSLVFSMYRINCV